MKNKIFIAFILNLSFSFFELLGGLFTGSVAILSDSLHDFGDALSIGISALLEKKSQRKPDDKYTYGYKRFSLLGGLIMWFILIVGSSFVVVNSIKKLITPSELNYDGMIVIAIFGLLTNLLATIVTGNGESSNQRAVSFHLLEDTVGWFCVLLGAVAIKLTHLTVIDPILSLLTALFIFTNAIKGIKEITEIFLEKLPDGIDLYEIKNELLKIEGVIDVHHIHIRLFDEHTFHASLHAVVPHYSHEVKSAIKNKLRKYGIKHITVELETEGETCEDKICTVDACIDPNHHHQH